MNESTSEIKCPYCGSNDVIIFCTNEKIKFDSDKNEFYSSEAGCLDCYRSFQI